MCEILTWAFTMNPRHGRPVQWPSNSLLQTRVSKVLKVRCLGLFVGLHACACSFLPLYSWDAYYIRNSRHPKPAVC